MNHNLMPDWEALDTVVKMQEWINSCSDPDGALEKVREAHEKEEKRLHRWVAAAVLGDFCAYGFSDKFNEISWDSEAIENDDGEEYRKCQETVLKEIAGSFNNFTALAIEREDRRASGSEDAWIDISEDGSIEAISEYWIMASNETFWNVTVEFFDDGPSITFEYVEGSYEELRS